MPQHILDDPDLCAALTVLPSNYSFEVHKTVWRLRQAKVRSLALQFPEGLLLYATALSDIFQTFAGVQVNPEPATRNPAPATLHLRSWTSEPSTLDPGPWILDL